MIKEKLKQLNPTIDDNYLDFCLEQLGTNYEPHLETFFNNTNIQTINQVYRENDLIIIEFSSNNENLVFVAGLGDCVPYTAYVYTLANLGVFGNVLDSKPLTLEDEKTRKIKELDNKYEQAQIVELVNGICFTAILKGEWYISILEKRKSSARSRQDRLCYIKIPAYYTDDPQRTEKSFEGALPLSFVEIVDSKWDMISLDNFRFKEAFLEEIKNAQSIEELPEIIFPAIREIDLNLLAEEYIQDETQRQQDRDLVASKKREDNQYHLFTEFNATKSIQDLYEGTNIIP